MEILTIKRKIILVATLTASISLHAETLNCPCQVVHIVDGDTVHVIDTNKIRIKIRLADIDAPEKIQAYGSKSTKNLESYIAGKLIEIKYSKKDRYGRIIGKLLFNGKDINLQQVKDGFAWHYKYYQGEQSPRDRELYAQAEESAKKLRVGLWKEANPMPPWLFRKKNKH